MQPFQSASVQSPSGIMGFLGGFFYGFTLPLAVVAWSSRRMWHELEEKHAKLEGSEAPNFGNNPIRNLFKGRRTVEDEWRWWCEFLSKKHEECAKLTGSDEPPCDVFKNGWLKDCATLDGKPKPKQVSAEGKGILRVKGIDEDYYFYGDAN